MNKRSNLIYFDISDEEKSFIKLTHGGNVIKLFLSVLLGMAK
jgi:hypothetical protein